VHSGRRASFEAPHPSRSGATWAFRCCRLPRRSGTGRKAALIAPPARPMATGAPSIVVGAVESPTTPGATFRRPRGVLWGVAQGSCSGGRRKSRTSVRMTAKVIPVGILRRTPRGYVEPGPPPSCPRGHTLRGAWKVIVGTQQCAHCSELGLGPHRSYTCRTCKATVYEPRAGPHCTFVALDGRKIPHMPTADE
jgi:hypothetical protein